MKAQNTLHQDLCIPPQNNQKRTNQPQFDLILQERKNLNGALFEKSIIEILSNENLESFLQSSLAKERKLRILDQLLKKGQISKKKLLIAIHSLKIYPFFLCIPPNEIIDFFFDNNVEIAEKEIEYQLLSLNQIKERKIQTILSKIGTSFSTKIEQVQQDINKNIEKTFSKLQTTLVLKLFQIEYQRENVNNQSGLTPLHYAAKKNFKEAGEILILKGADINPIDIMYQTIIVLC